jgi:hypothetical protein
MKAAAEIPLETVRAAITEWPEHLEAEGGHLSGININKNLKLLLTNYLARKVDVLFHFPSVSQCTGDRTSGRTVYICHITTKDSAYTVTSASCYYLYRLFILVPIPCPFLKTIFISDICGSLFIGHFQYCNFIFIFMPL